MVAFKLEGEDAKDVIDSMYTASLKTPTSIQGISDAMKNSASAFATLTEFTTQSGTDLDLYKKKLLDLNVAMTGKLATLGKVIVCRVKTLLIAGKHLKRITTNCIWGHKTGQTVMCLV